MWWACFILWWPRWWPKSEQSWICLFIFPSPPQNFILMLAALATPKVVETKLRVATVNKARKVLVTEFLHKKLISWDLFKNNGRRWGTPNQSRIVNALDCMDNITSCCKFTILPISAALMDFASHGWTGNRPFIWSYYYTVLLDSTHYIPTGQGVSKCLRIQAVPPYSVSTLSRIAL